MRVCKNPECGIEFESPYPEKLYCSVGCSRRAGTLRKLVRLREANELGPLRASTPLGLLLRGGLDLTGKPAQTRGNPFLGWKVAGNKVQKAGIYSCGKCDRAFWAEGLQGVGGGQGGHGLLTCPDCRLLTKKMGANRQNLKGQCERCGFLPEHPTQIEGDHIDGNRKNNKKANFQALCANCHTLKHQAPDVFLLTPIHKVPGFISTHRLAA